MSFPSTAIIPFSFFFREIPLFALLYSGARDLSKKNLPFPSTKSVRFSKKNYHKGTPLQKH
jgi:hypothetical protein